MDNTFDFSLIVPKFDGILSRGLCSGVGHRDGQMCIEAAICAVLDLPHGDDPKCVTPAVRSFKISLNDLNWSSAKSRAEGLRSLGIAQIGSKGVVDDAQFISRLTEKIIKQLIPHLYRAGATRFDEPHKSAFLKAADTCEKEGTQQSAAWAAGAARADKKDSDFYLRFVANLAFEVLVDLKSPGALWLLQHEKGIVVK